ncbi:MAG: APC family permease [bacterium]|jgi:APA family basic amino acid/polyamine antiporter
MEETKKQIQSDLKGTLSLFDVVCIIVGVIVGTGIFMTPPLIAGYLSSGSWILFLWFLGGLFSLIGALCYAELATTYPKAGGDYWYLTRAYGNWSGFLFAWTKLWVTGTGSIAAISYIVGEYATALLPFQYSNIIYSLIAVIGCTVINCLGIQQGKITQNILTIAKVIGLILVFLVAFLLESPENAAPPSFELTFGSFFMALIFVQFTFGGWNECAYIAAEVKNPSRNIVRSLVIGLFTVTTIYLLVNAAFIHALGVQGLAQSEAVAADVFIRFWGSTGGRIVSALILISALGAVNGYVLTGARIYYTMGHEHALFSFMGKWNDRLQTPIRALIVQGLITSVLVLSGQFEALIRYTTPAHWMFFVLTGISLFILRYRDSDIVRPYRVHFYPVTPIIFILSSGALFYSGLNYAGLSAIIGFLIVLAGLPFYFLSEKMEKRHGVVRTENQEESL